MKARAGFYARDLAHVHDSGFLGFVRAAESGIVGRLRRAVPAGGLVVEIGCGSGELARSLIAKGWEAIGIDISAEMLRLARKKAPGGRFRLADWREYAPPPCDALVAVGEVFNYLQGAPKVHEKALSGFFARAYSALRPGGFVIFDFLETASGRRPPREFLAAGLDWIVSGRVSERGRIVRRRINIARIAAGRWRISGEVHRQLRIGRAVAARILRERGFDVRFFPGHGRTRLPGGHVVAVARKPR